MNLSRFTIVIATVMVSLAGCGPYVTWIPKEQAEKNELVVYLKAFKNDTGRYPTSDEGLQALVEDPGISGWQGPYCIGNTQSVFQLYTYRRESNDSFHLERRGLH